MNWINTLIPVVTLIIGWALSEFGKLSSERKNDRKNLKKLLFNLLEIRWLLKRDFEFKEELTTYIEKFEIKVEQKFGQDAAQGAHLIEPIITQILKEKLIRPNRIEEIENRIGSIVDNLSEIYPIFAYELTDVYRIRERIEGIECYFEEISERIEYVTPEMKEWAKPRISNELIKRLEEYILDISGKINRKTQKGIERILKESNDRVDDEEIDLFIDEYIQNFS
ncbi:hypothetical protein M3P19_05145 [Muricauda sp. 2012CJ35-5]|uniref:Uncharacterized protein n=1 Tax=Flagellimonas spongiicola TaxID=2942208 RepID=A0ABT0PPU5_9FLAO|nr:hypothetical protein [Allomuricauda spongiicola]MCL6273384.1 hypothetical protein [Allomuricauda spongiicola]